MSFEIEQRVNVFNVAEREVTVNNPLQVVWRPHSEGSRLNLRFFPQAGTGAGPRAEITFDPSWTPSFARGVELTVAAYVDDSSPGIGANVAWPSNFRFADPLHRHMNPHTGGVTVWKIRSHGDSTTFKVTREFVYQRDGYQTLPWFEPGSQGQLGSLAAIDTYATSSVPSIPMGGPIQLGAPFYQKNSPSFSGTEGSIWLLSGYGSSGQDYAVYQRAQGEVFGQGIPGNGTQSFTGGDINGYIDVQGRTFVYGTAPSNYIHFLDEERFNEPNTANNWTSISAPNASGHNMVHAARGFVAGEPRVYFIGSNPALIHYSSNWSSNPPTMNVAATGQSLASRLNSHVAVADTHHGGGTNLPGSALNGTIAIAYYNPAAPTAGSYIGFLGHDEIAAGSPVTDQITKNFDAGVTSSPYGLCYNSYWRRWFYATLANSTEYRMYYADVGDESGTWTQVNGVAVGWPARENSPNDGLGITFGFRMFSWGPYVVMPVLGGQRGYLWSSDGGESWQVTPVPGTAFFLTATRNRLYVGGTSGLYATPLHGRDRAWTKPLRDIVAL